MKAISFYFASILVRALAVYSLITETAFAAEVTKQASHQIATSPATSMLKTVLGLFVVLIVMGIVAWFAKRMTGRHTGTYSAARIVGGVSVGSRERVVVLEVGNRWLVVGVAPGQVNAIANLGIEDGVQIDQTLLDEHTAPTQPVNLMNVGVHAGKSFASWLKQATNKATNGTNEH